MMLFKKDPEEVAPCVKREMQESDLGFICNSWVKSYFALNEHLRNYSPFVYYAEIQQKVVEYLIGSAKVVVICAEDDPDHIYGYGVYEPGPKTILHYLYVKYPFRRLGIGKIIYNHMLSDHDHTRQPVCSHVNGTWQKIYRYKYDLIHEPFNLEEIKDEDHPSKAS